MGWVTRVAESMGFKRLSQMRFPGRAFVFFDHARPGDDAIRHEVGTGLGANVLMTPVRWLQRSFVEAPLVLQRGDDVVDGAEVVNLVNNPNPFYAAEHLWYGTILSLVLDGNAYWLCVRNGRGRIVELWYVPHWLVEPHWPSDGSTFISHYEYTVAGHVQRLDVEDVIHFRDGIDPENLRKGHSALKSLVREIWTDQEAALFSASMLRNGGVPGVVISPDGDGTISQDEADAAKTHFASEFTRENRGKPIVFSGKTRVSQFGFSPQQLDMSALRNISEERVTAALGVPAAVVGFGTGIEQTRVGATLRELRRLAWLNGVIPMQRLISGQLTHDLLPRMGERNARLVFDNADVVALQEDENERVSRITQLVQAGIWTRGEARMETGMKPTPSDDVYLMNLNVITVPRTAVPEQFPGAETRGRDVTVKSHSPLEERLARESPIVDRAPEMATAFAAQIDRIRREFPAAMEAELDEFFRKLGDDTERVAAGALAEEFRSAPVETKQTPEESRFVAQVEEGLAMSSRLPLFQQIFERHYLRVGEAAFKAVAGVLGLETGLPDPVARAVIAAGGRRAGLVDLSAQTRRQLFDKLTEGRAAGMGGDNLARFIRDGVEAGPWSSRAVRAKIIARTETIHAANVSTVQSSKNAGVQSMLVLDNRTGFGDPVCSALNMRVVTLQQAEQLAIDEHPNGTRNFTPLPGALESELRAQGRIREPTASERQQHLED